MNRFFRFGVLFATLFLYSEFSSDENSLNAKPFIKKNTYLYKDVLNFIKEHENPKFKVKTIHDDGAGYNTIGYGHLIKDNETFANYITIQQADSLLKVDYSYHMQCVVRAYPGLNENQIHAITHMSFCIGIGRIIKNNLVYKSKWGTWRINHKKVLSFSYLGPKFRQDMRNLRKYELNLWSGKEIYKIIK